MIIGMNEPCLCGSGKKFKKCCRNRIDYKLRVNSYDFDIIGLKNIIDKVYKRKKSSKCLYSDCDCKAIDSHVIQEKGILKLLSENGEVCHNFRNANSYKFKDYSDFKGEQLGLTHVIGGTLDDGNYCFLNFMNFEKSSISNVSVFKGFCNFHDTKLFKDIEFFSVEDLNFNNKANEVFLYCYRLFCYFYNSCEIDTMIMRLFFKENINVFYNNSKAINNFRLYNKELTCYLKEKERLDDLLHINKFDVFNTNYITLPYRLPFCSMSLLPLSYGNDISFSYLFVIPNIDKTHIYFCWDKEKTDLGDGLLHYFNPVNSVAITNLILYAKTKIVIRPSIVDLIEKNEAYCKLLLSSDIFGGVTNLKTNLIKNIEEPIGVDLLKLDK